jgi:hypothetical protein
MKLKSQQRTALPRPPRKARRARVVAARSLTPERPTRVWSLLLPPSFPVDRK